MELKVFSEYTLSSALRSRGFRRALSPFSPRETQTSGNDYSENLSAIVPLSKNFLIKNTIKKVTTLNQDLTIIRGERVERHDWQKQVAYIF